MTSTAQIDERVIAICISEQYKHCLNDKHCLNAKDLYNSTRGLWRVSRAGAEKAEYAFAVYFGEIQEVEIEHWMPVSKALNDYWMERCKSQGRILNPAINKGRSEFIGEVDIPSTSISW